MKPEYKEAPSPPTQTQQLLTPLRESIVEKPPYISGKLQRPASCFSLLYMLTKDGHAARFEDSPILGAFWSIAAN
jgi:hypothetical protein